MILKKELGTVTLEKSDENVTGKMGLSFIYHSMKHFGLNDWIQEIFPKAKQRSNREETAEKKILAQKSPETGFSLTEALVSMGWSEAQDRPALDRLVFVSKF